MYKLIIEHNTLYFGYAKGFAVFFFVFYYFRLKLSRNVEKTIAILAAVF